MACLSERRPLDQANSRAGIAIRDTSIGANGTVYHDGILERRIGIPCGSLVITPTNKSTWPLEP